MRVSGTARRPKLPGDSAKGVWLLIVCDKLDYLPYQIHRCLQAWAYPRALPGLFQIVCTHITRTRRENPLYSICMLTQAQTYYSAQYSDKIHFPQLRIKCRASKSCPGTHTALQASMTKLHKEHMQYVNLSVSFRIYRWECLTVQCWHH